MMIFIIYLINGFVQDCSNSGVLAIELLQSCVKPANLVEFIQNINNRHPIAHLLAWNIGCPVSSVSKLF